MKIQLLKINKSTTERKHYHNHSGNAGKQRLKRLEAVRQRMIEIENKD